MHLGPLHHPDTLTSVSSVASLELIMAVAIIVLAILLWGARSKRERDQQRRKAASSGYYNPDAARFGAATGGGPARDSATGDAGASSLAPSFTAPVLRKSGRTAVRHRTTPSPVVQPVPVPSFPAYDLVEAESEPVPPFDPTVPAYRGPARQGSASASPSGAPPPPPPPPPPVPPVLPEHRA